MTRNDQNANGQTRVSVLFAIPNGKEIFFHSSAIYGRGHRQPARGRWCLSSMSPESGPKGPREPMSAGPPT